MQGPHSLFVSFNGSDSLVDLKNKSQNVSLS